MVMSPLPGPASIESMYEEYLSIPATCRRALELQEDGWLFLGSSEATDPHEVEGAYQIKSFREVPDMFNEHHEFKAML